MSRTKILLALCALLFLVAVVVALQHLGDAGNQEVVNQYRGSQFSFTYPLGLDIEEYPNGALAIGSTTPAGFAPAVALTLLTPANADESDDITTSFDEQILALCSENGPSVRVFCGRVESSDMVTTKGGERAQAYYLSMTKERPGMAPETMTIGPLYAYLLEASEDAPSEPHKLLVVHNPPHDFVTGSADAALLNRINDSVTLGEPRRR